MSNQDHPPSIDNPHFWDWMGQCMAESDRSRDVVSTPPKTTERVSRATLNGYYNFDELIQIKRLAEPMISIETKASSPRMINYRGYQQAISGGPPVTTIEGYFTHESYNAAIKVGRVISSTHDQFDGDWDDLPF